MSDDPAGRFRMLGGTYLPVLAGGAGAGSSFGGGGSTTAATSTWHPRC